MNSSWDMRHLQYFYMIHRVGRVVGSETWFVVFVCVCVRVCVCAYDYICSHESEARMERARIQTDPRHNVFISETRLANTKSCDQKHDVFICRERHWERRVEAGTHDRDTTCYELVV